MQPRQSWFQWKLIAACMQSKTIHWQLYKEAVAIRLNLSTRITTMNFSAPDHTFRKIWHARHVHYHEQHPYQIDVKKTSCAAE